MLCGDELRRADRAPARALLLGEPNERAVEARALLEVDLPGDEAAPDLGELDAGLEQLEHVALAEDELGRVGIGAAQALGAVVEDPGEGGDLGDVGDGPRHGPGGELAVGLAERLVDRVVGGCERREDLPGRALSSGAGRVPVEADLVAPARQCRARQPRQRVALAAAEDHHPPADPPGRPRTWGHQRRS